MTEFKKIVDRVEASMCITYGTEHPNGREEARISRDDWDHLKRAIEFYRRPEHWMSLSEDGPSNLLVAQGDVSGMDGWLMAEGKSEVRH